MTHARESSPASLVDRIVAVGDRFNALGGLQPGEEIDKLFAELMKLCQDPPDTAAEEVLNDPRIRAIVPRLRKICARAEYERELVWARRMLEAQADPPTLLSAAPFVENYQRIVLFETSAIRGAGHADPRSVLMVGSGPLPFTAVLYAQALGGTGSVARVDSLDVEPDACACAKRLYHAFGIGGASQVHRANILRFTDLSRYDLVILGAGVGLTRQKRLQAITHLAAHMRPGAILLVRTAHGMRTLLFPQIDAEDLEGFVPQLLVRPFNGVINSVLVAHK